MKVDVRLNRKYVPKEGVAPEDVFKLNSWGGVSVDREKIDKAKGEFFLAFETGAWGEGTNRIVPVSDEQAKDIVEERCSFDEYVSRFGDPRGITVSPENVKSAVKRQRMVDYEEKVQIEKERDTAKSRISELEERIRELENR